MKQQKIRNLHRDLGYFYVGLIISFATSGILMNHRDMWEAQKFNVIVKEISVKISPNDVTETYAKQFISKYGIKDTFRKFKNKAGLLRISYKNTDVEIDLTTGKGEIETYQKTPIISQMMFLHKNTSNWWIYYSDIFGISLITIAVTGTLMIPRGNLSFKERGWKLALLGLVFPIVLLIFL